MFIRFLLCLILIYMGSSPYSCCADLSWSNPTQTIFPDSNAKTVIAKFLFTNSGSTKITITSIRTSCGCTTADLKKRIYEPGEKSTLDVSFAIGNQTGMQRKTIIVSTNDSKHSNYILSLNVDVPELLAFSSRYVVWELGASPVPQAIELSAKTAMPVQIISVTSDSLNINAVLHVVRPGAEYSIQVTPTRTTVEARGTLTIETNVQQDGHNRKFFAYADVRARLKNKPTATN